MREREEETKKEGEREEERKAKRTGDFCHVVPAPFYNFSKVSSPLNLLCTMSI